MRRITMAEYIDSFKTAERDVPDTNVGDLISRQAAIEAIKRYESAYSYDLNNGLILAMNSVADVPTIDAVPVVRCKDCKHWGMHKRLNVPWCFAMHIDKSANGYCDSGERREE